MNIKDVPSSSDTFLYKFLNLEYYGMPGISSKYTAKLQYHLRTVSDLTFVNTDINTNLSSYFATLNDV